MSISKSYLILRAALVALLAIVFCQNVYADLSINDFQKIALKGTHDQKKTIEMYIGGVGAGYKWANTALNSSKQPLLFCFDGDMTTKDFYDMALEAIRLRKKNNAKDDGDTPVEMVLLIHLKKLYPCSQ